MDNYLGHKTVLLKDMVPLVHQRKTLIKKYLSRLEFIKETMGCDRVTTFSYVSKNFVS